MKKEFIGYWQLVLAEIFIAIPYIIARLGKDLGNSNLSFFRVFFACIFLGLFGLVFKRYRIAKLKKEKLRLLIFGAFHGFIILASYISLNLLTISSAVILQSTIGIFTAIFSILILKEKLRFKVILALIFSFIGLIVIINPSDFLIGANLLGILAALFVGIFGGLVYALSKTFKTYDKVSLTFWQNLIAVPFLLPLIFLYPPVFTGFSITIFLALGLFGAASFAFLYLGFEKIEGQRAAAFTLLYLVFAILLGILFFKEIPTLREIIGGILIISGGYLATK